MKEYVLILIFNENYSKCLMVKRKRKPYASLYNGIGGKVENNESIENCAIRETKEETGIDLISPKHLYTLTYPELEGYINSGVKMNIFYDSIEAKRITENYEGTYHWLSVDYLMKFNNRKFAGLNNISQMVKEILDKENIRKFYS